MSEATHYRELLSTAVDHWAGLVRSEHSLDHLPVGTVVLDKNRRAWQSQLQSDYVVWRAVGNDWWYKSGALLRAFGPLELIYVATEDEGE